MAVSKPTQKGCEELPLSPNTSDVTLSISDVQDVSVKKSAQEKFSDINALCIFPQVQKNMQGAMTTF